MSDSYEFFPLANVDENPEVSLDTYCLVVNGEEVQKTKVDKFNQGQYKNYTDSYEEWKTDPLHVIEDRKSVV